MSTQVKIIFILIVIVAGIAAISFGLGSFFSNQPDEPETPDPIVLTDPSLFESSPLVLSDQFEIDLVSSWELAVHTPDRQVDRYRFERKGDETAIFAVSIYEDRSIVSFDDLIERRYGGAVLESVEDLEINGLPAKRVRANFLGGDNTDRSGADMLIQIEENFYISLNGLRVPSGEKDILIISELDFMQTSLRVL